MSPNIDLGLERPREHGGAAGAGGGLSTRTHHHVGQLRDLQRVAEGEADGGGGAPLLHRQRRRREGRQPAQRLQPDAQPPATSAAARPHSVSALEKPREQMFYFVLRINTEFGAVAAHGAVAAYTI